MDSRYAGALKAFISHNPNEAPIDPAAPDPLMDRGQDMTPPLSPIGPPAAAGAQNPHPLDLLPLIFAQLPLQPTYRLRRPPMSPRVPGGPSMTGR